MTTRSEDEGGFEQRQGDAHSAGVDARVGAGAGQGSRTGRLGSYVATTDRIEQRLDAARRRLMRLRRIVADLRRARDDGDTATCTRLARHMQSVLNDLDLDMNGTAALIREANAAERFLPSIEAARVEARELRDEVAPLAPAFSTELGSLSTDVNGSGVDGSAMVDAPRADSLLDQRGTIDEKEAAAAKEARATSSRSGSGGFDAPREDSILDQRGTVDEAEAAEAKRAREAATRAAASGGGFDAPRADSILDQRGTVDEAEASEAKARREVAGDQRVGAIDDDDLDVPREDSIVDECGTVDEGELADRGDAMVEASLGGDPEQSVRQLLTQRVRRSDKKRIRRRKQQLLALIDGLGAEDAGTWRAQIANASSELGRLMRDRLSDELRQRVLRLLAERAGTPGHKQVAVQLRGDGGEASPEETHASAARGVAGPGSTLPYAEQIQVSFGPHDISGVVAHIGGPAAEASRAMGAEAFATGKDVAFREAPSLHTAAHEAAHVVQQRGGVQLEGGIGALNDRYEQEADRVADLVVAGRSAAAELGPVTGGATPAIGVQRKPSKDPEATGGVDLASFGFGHLNPSPLTPDAAAGAHAPIDLARFGFGHLNHLLPPNPAESPAARASKAVEAIDEGVRSVILIQEALDEARVAISGRELERSRSATSSIRIDFARAELCAEAADVIADAIADASQRDALLGQLAVLEESIERLRPEVDEILRREPPAAASMPDEVPEADPTADWSARLDTEDAEAWASAPPAPLEDEQCQPDGPHAKDAVTGIRLYILAKGDIKNRRGQMADFHSIGPGRVGPYILHPNVKNREIVYYVAYHEERKQNEWLIGPADAAAFADAVMLYASTARASLPGSKKVADSQNDGADKAAKIPSMLELEAFGEAPYQQMDFSLNPLVGTDAANGGPSLVAARNAHLRLEDYTKEARRLAGELKAKMDAGEIGHMEARTQAVDGRNQAMLDTRAKLSPAARNLSQHIKSDQGMSVEAMTNRKTVDLLTESMPGGKGMKVLGLPGDDAALRAFLEQDSALWAKYRQAMLISKDVERVFRAAVDDLGDQPPVSRAIVNSAGKSNKFVTGLAKIGRAGAGALAVVGVYDMVTTIANAEEGELLHVAAGELGGFAGGIIGGEAGSIWVASLIATGPGAVVIVVSIIAGFLGASIGGQVGRMVGQLMTEAATVPLHATSAIVSPGSAQGGGYAGLHERSQRAGMRSKSIKALLGDAIFELDETLEQVEGKIEEAADRDKLEQLQRMRLGILEQRDQLGMIYGALQAGLLSEEDAWTAVGGGADAS